MDNDMEPLEAPAAFADHAFDVVMAPAGWDDCLLGALPASAARAARRPRNGGAEHPTRGAHGGNAAQPGARGGKRIRQGRKDAKLQEDFRALAAAWNREHGLRHGDTVDVMGGARRMHPLAWTTEGMIRFAMRGIGSNRQCGDGIGVSRRGLEAMASLAEILTQLQLREVETRLCEIAAGQSSALVLTRAYDCTRMLCKLGVHRASMAPFVRELVKDDSLSGRYRLRKLCPGDVLPRVGVVGLCAQEVEILSGPILEHIWQKVLLPPMALSDAGASTLFTALDCTKEVSIQRLNEIAGQVPLVILSERPDAAPSNRRLQQEVAQRLDSNILYDVGTCAAHGVQRVVENTLKDSATTGDIYALQFVLQLVPHQNQLLRQLHDVVRRLLVRLDGHAIAPDPAFRCHTEAVLKNTIGLRILRTRARSES